MTEAEFWEAARRARTDEERKRRRAAGLPPFDRYWRGCEAITIYEWGSGGH